MGEVPAASFEWFVVAVTDSSVEGLEELLPQGNARELPPLNGRTVRYRKQR